MMKLADTNYLTFPFRISENGPMVSQRADHLREQIEQLLFTSPKERVFNPDFGIGLKSLLFEPNQPALFELTKKKLMIGLKDILFGEVNPNTIEIDITGYEETISITISYELTTINQQKQYTYTLSYT